MRVGHCIAVAVGRALSSFSAVHQSEWWPLIERGCWVERWLTFLCVIDSRVRGTCVCLRWLTMLPLAFASLTRQESDYYSSAVALGGCRLLSQRGHHLVATPESSWANKLRILTAHSTWSLNVHHLPWQQDIRTLTAIIQSFSLAFEKEKIIRKYITYYTILKGYT